MSNSPLRGIRPDGDPKAIDLIAQRRYDAPLELARSHGAQPVDVPRCCLHWLSAHSAARDRPRVRSRRCSVSIGVVKIVVATSFPADVRSPRGGVEAVSVILVDALARQT